LIFRDFDLTGIWPFQDFDRFGNFDLLNLTLGFGPFGGFYLLGIRLSNFDAFGIWPLELLSEFLPFRILTYHGFDRFGIPTFWNWPFGILTFGLTGLGFWPWIMTFRGCTVWGLTVWNLDFSGFLPFEDFGDLTFGIWLFGILKFGDFGDFDLLEFDFSGFWPLELSYFGFWLPSFIMIYIFFRGTGWCCRII